MTDPVKKYVLRWPGIIFEGGSNRPCYMEKDTVDFFEGRQWAQEQITAITARPRPVFVVNRVRRANDIPAIESAG